MKIKSILLNAVLAPLAVAGFMVASAGVGHADTFGSVFGITYNGCSSGCGSLSSYGTVSVSGDGTTSLTFDVDLTSNVYFHDNGNGTTFQFSLTGATVTAADVSGLTSGQGWAFIPNATTLTVNPLDHLGTFTYGFQCSGLGSANTCGNELNFTLTLGSNGTLANEIGGSHGDLAFGLDLSVCPTLATTAACAGTGPFGATAVSVPGPIVGAGLPGLVVACGGLLALARRRRQNIA